MVLDRVFWTSLGIPHAVPWGVDTQLGVFRDILLSFMASSSFLWKQQEKRTDRSLQDVSVGGSLQGCSLRVVLKHARLFSELLDLGPQDAEEVPEVRLNKQAPQSCEFKDIFNQLPPLLKY